MSKGGGVGDKVREDLGAGTPEQPGTFRLLGGFLFISARGFEQRNGKI